MILNLVVIGHIVSKERPKMKYFETNSTDLFDSPLGQFALILAIPSSVIALAVAAMAAVRHEYGS